ncbi:class III cytochrome C family protein [bacterium BMS3Bbin09]|nr:class III cytochrome C family protein [bacterium BMS3Bbin09]
MKKFILYAVAILLILPASTINVYSEEEPVVEKTPPVENSSIYTKGYPKKIPEFLKSQFFCGYCHILTYPKVIKEAHNSWMTSKHKDVPCVDCHYPPGRLDVAIPEHDKIPRDEETATGKKTDMEYMKSELEVLSRLTTILNMDEPVIRKKPRIDDNSCTIKCHLKSGKGKEGEFWTKKIKFVEVEREDKSIRVISYIHKTHFDKTKSVEGQEIHCQTCHQHETKDKHFEVSRKKCFLCHFKNAELNKGRAKCSLCHEIPTKPLQRQKVEGAPEKEGEKTINHKSIEADGVKCASCHGHMIRGKGEVVQQMCLDCHDNEEAITKEASNKKLMHEKHVADQNASCFDCHAPIEHNKKADYIDTARLQCQTCHPDHHKYQRLLLEGAQRPGVPSIPALMAAVNTNCTACHIEEKIINGEKVANGTGKACAACHTPKHEGMVEEWKSSTASAAKEAKEIEKDAEAAIEAAKATATPEQIEEANKMMENGRGNLNIVEYGGGVHNKKYSVTLIDAAMTSFEDAIDLLAEEEEEGVEVDCECSDGKLDCADEDAKAEAKTYECACDDEDYVVCQGDE